MTNIQKLMWVLLLGACGPAQYTLETSDYDTSCDTSAQCTLVNTLACTNVCDEQAGAISRSSEATFVQDRASLTGQCAPAIAPSCEGEVYPEGLQQYVAVCLESQCQLHKRVRVELTTPDISCTSNQECTLVNNSDPCDPCQCTVVGVRKDKEAAFTAARTQLKASTNCGAGKGVCNISGCSDIDYVPVCVQGRCGVEYAQN